MQNALHDTFQPLDPGRVNTMDPAELRYWCDQFHCTEQELVETVERVGEHVAAVRQAFEARGRG